MTSAILSDEKESLLLKIPPIVNIEVVEDSDEEYDITWTAMTYELVLQPVIDVET